MTMFQLFEFLFVLTAYAVILVWQVTLGERRLRSVPWRAAILQRIGFSLVHGFIGLLTFAILGSYVNICISGDYRYGLFGDYGFLFTLCGGGVGLAIPWLGLLRKKGDNGGHKSVNDEPVQDGA
jgi:hypothetical protein